MTAVQRLQLSYDPQPRQALLHSTLARQILYGGAAGGGKSHALRWEGYTRCLLNPGAQVYLFRRTLNNLEKNHIVRIGEEMPKDLASFNRNRYALEFKNGSIMWFCYSENEGDVENYQGAEIHELLLDEAALFTPYQIGYLRSRNRIGGFKPRQPQYLPRIVMGSNPGGPSHDWLKRRFVVPAPPETVFFDEKVQKDTIYIPARMDDNAYLEAGYASQFADMPEHQRRMFVEGDWDAVAGSYFDCWNTARHVIPTCRIPAEWSKFRSIDWGFRTPFSVGWWAVGNGEPLIDKTGKEIEVPEGALVRYREWYGAKLDSDGVASNIGLNLKPSEVAEGIRKRSGDEKIDYTVIDPSAARGDAGPSVREQLNRGGVGTIAGDNKRDKGWQELYGRLNNGELFVMDNCRDFIRTVPLMMPKETDPEDIEKGGEDHVADEARYACMSRPRVKAVREEAESERGFYALLKQARRRSGPKRERIAYGR